MSQYYNDIITTVLEEIIQIIDDLKGERAIRAYACYKDFCGDVKKLNSRDYGAACALLWYSIEDAGFKIYSDNDLRAVAGFQLAW